MLTCRCAHARSLVFDDDFHAIGGDVSLLENVVSVAIRYNAYATSFRTNLRKYCAIIECLMIPCVTVLVHFREGILILC